MALIRIMRFYTAIYIHLILSSVFSVYTAGVCAQTPLVYSNNVVVFVNYSNEDTSLYVNGSWQHVGDSIRNLGRVFVGDDFKIDGLVSGDGDYIISGDWENNGNFKPGESTVLLSGTDQEVGGTQPTSFYNLALPGSGTKTLSRDIFVNNLLDLNDAELAAGFTDDVVTVLGTDVLSVRRGNSGFVSGTLIRTLTEAETYIFPVGSNIGTGRYRPVAITPNSALDTSLYSVAMINHDPTLDGCSAADLDTSICSVLSDFYFNINRMGADTPHISLAYDVAVDGRLWNSIAKWQLSQQPHWRLIKNSKDNFDRSYLGNGVAESYLGVMSRAMNRFADSSLFIIAARYPDSLPFFGKSLVCMNEESTHYEAWGYDTATYIWTTANGTGDFLNGQTSREAEVKWGALGRDTLILVYKPYDSRCPTQPERLPVYVVDNSVAAMNVTSASGHVDTTAVYAYDPLSFVSLSALRADSIVVHWWDFGDGYQNYKEHPHYMYGDAGTYEVVFRIEDSNGCIDSDTIQIEVVSGLDAPNVFTPNGDGYNDYFRVRSGGVKDFSLVIYNRYGVVVFESNNSAFQWDGRTLSGQLASDGTYFYIIKANSETKPYEKQGYVQLVR